MRAARLVVVLSLAAGCVTKGDDDDDAWNPGVDSSDQDGDGDQVAPAACDVAPTEPPAGLGLDPFYTKYVWAGLPVVGSANVTDAAFPVACDIVAHMLAERPDIAAELRSSKIRVGIMAASEVTTDMPEHSDLDTAFPDVDWDTRARGLGATLDRPLTSCGEENLLPLDGDPYVGESILVHEFGHTMWVIGVRGLPDGNAKNAELVAAYDDAIVAGTFANTYAATDEQEYWAEGVQDWFDTNLSAEPSNGIHNSIDTRAELIAADPTLAALVEELFGDGTDWHPAPY